MMGTLVRMLDAKMTAYSSASTNQSCTIRSPKALISSVKSVRGTPVSSRAPMSTNCAKNIKIRPKSMTSGTRKMASPASTVRGVRVTRSVVSYASKTVTAASSVSQPRYLCGTSATDAIHTANVHAAKIITNRRALRGRSCPPVAAADALSGA